MYSPPKPFHVHASQNNFFQPAFQTSGLDQSAVKRAVIVLPGEVRSVAPLASILRLTTFVFLQPRDCWYCT